MQVEYNINKVQDTSYPLAQYGLLDVHSPVAPGLTKGTTNQHVVSWILRSVLTWQDIHHVSMQGSKRPIPAIGPKKKKGIITPKSR
jgi:hypothetical protein